MLFNVAGLEDKINVNISDVRDEHSLRYLVRGQDLLFNLAGINENVATVISTSCGIANNFALNTAFNFKVRDNLLRRFVQFYAVGLSGILLTVGLFAVFVTWLGISPNIVKVGSLLPVLVLQYGLNKVWTFK